MAIATWSAPAPTSASMRRRDRSGRCAGLALALLAAVYLSAACGPDKKKAAPTAIEAGTETSGMQPYLFGGEQSVRDLHWTRSGDLLGVSARAVWMLPKGVLGPGAHLLDTAPSPGPRTLVSTYDTRMAEDRWLLGGDGFVSMRDPKTLAETKRFAVQGQIHSLLLAAEAPVAIAISCENGCSITRLALDSGSAVLLGRTYRDDPPALTADGKYLAFIRSEGLGVFSGEDPTPIFALPLDRGNQTPVFKPDGSVLFASDTQLSRWKPGDKAASSTALPRSENGWSFTTDARQGTIVASQSYGGGVIVYDGTTAKPLKTNEFGCSNGRLALDDPNVVECDRPEGRIDANGVYQANPRGTALLTGEKAYLRSWGDGCELVERGSDKILGWDRMFCGAQFSPDGAQLAWLDASGAPRVHGVSEIGEPYELHGNNNQITGHVSDGAFVARFDQKIEALDIDSARRDGGDGGSDNGFRMTAVPDDLRMYNGYAVSSAGAFFPQPNRMLGIDFSGKPALRTVILRDGPRSDTYYAWGGSAVSTAYGHDEAKATLCRFGASCNEIEITPATTVVGYEAPWIITSTVTEPDAPAQSVYYLRHDEAREPPRRVIVGRACAPALLLDGGNLLACVSSGKVLGFDTRSGQSLGEPRDLPIPTLPTPRSIQRARTRSGLVHAWAAEVVGHGASSLFVRSSGWFGDAVHFDELPLSLGTADAGAPSADAGAPLQALQTMSTTVLGNGFAVTVSREGVVRTGGNEARAERLLACRRGDELLPYSSCRTK